MWLLASVVGLWPVVLALWGRGRLAVALQAAAIASVLAIVVSVFAVALMFAISIAGWVLAVLTIWRGRPARWRWAWAAIAFVWPIAPVVLLRVYVFEADRLPSASMSPTMVIGDHIYVEKLSLLWHALSRGDVIVFVNADGREFIKRVIAVGGETVAITHGTISIDRVAVPTTKLGPTTFWNQRDPSDDGRAVPAIAFAEELGGHRYQVLHAAPDPEGELTSTTEDHDFPTTDPLRPNRCEDASPRRGGAPPVVAPGEWPVMTTAPGGCRVPDGAVFVMGDNRDDSADSRIFGAVPVDRIVGRVTGVWLPGAAPGRAWGRLGAVE